MHVVYSSSVSSPYVFYFLAIMHLCDRFLTAELVADVPSLKDSATGYGISPVTDAGKLLSIEYLAMHCPGMKFCPIVRIFAVLDFMVQPNPGLIYYHAKTPLPG